MGSTFIASTRIGKLKKLGNLSSNLINEYGYCYFLRVAFYELRRQKLKLFFKSSNYLIFKSSIQEFHELL